MRNVLDKLGLKIIPSDHGFNGRSIVKVGDYIPPVDSTKFDGAVNMAALGRSACMKYRNKIIADEYRKHTHSNIFSQVGSFHLQGLEQEENLSNDFTLLIFDSCKKNLSETKNFCEQLYDYAFGLEPNEDEALDRYRASKQVINLVENFEDIENILMAMNPYELLDYITDTLEFPSFEKTQKFSQAI